MNIEQLRADFEAWYVTDCARHGFEITVEEVIKLRGPHGDYREWVALHGKWVGYQAGRAALQHFHKETSQDREDTERLDKLMQLADRYAIAVRDNWQPRKHRRALLDHARRVEENK